MKKLNDFKDWQDVQEHQKIGEILMQSGKLNLIHLGMALDIQRFENMQLGKILMEMKIITQQELEQALEMQKNIDARLGRKKEEA